MKQRKLMSVLIVMKYILTNIRDSVTIDGTGVIKILDVTESY